MDLKDFIYYKPINNNILSYPFIENLDFILNEFKNTNEIIIPFNYLILNFNAKKKTKCDEIKNRLRIMRTYIYNELNQYCKYLNSFSIIENKDLFFPNNNFTIRNFWITHYNLETIVCNNTQFIPILSTYTVIQFILFLNDSESEIDFYNADVKIKPIKGNILFFPSSWTFPYKYNKTNINQYIIKGFVYV